MKRVGTMGEVMVKKFYVDSSFGQVHVRETKPNKEGIKTKRPVICFHQSPLSGLQYKIFQEELGLDRVVWCPDTPGFGGSDSPFHEVTVKNYAEAMIPLFHKLLEETSYESFDIMGGHTGSVIALELGLISQNFVNKIILPSVAYFTNSERVEMKKRFVNEPAYFSDSNFVSKTYIDSVLNINTPVSKSRRLELFTERLRSGLNAWFAPNAVTSYDADDALRRTSHQVLILVLEDMLSENSFKASKVLKDCIVRDMRHISHDLAWDVEFKSIIKEIKLFLD